MHAGTDDGCKVALVAFVLAFSPALGSVGRPAKEPTFDSPLLFYCSQLAMAGDT